MTPSDPETTPREGGTDPFTGKTIQSMILRKQDLLVFLDGQCNVEWSFDREPPTGYGDVVNRLAYLDAKSQFISDKGQLEPIRRLMGEGLARILDEGDQALAMGALDNAKALIELRNGEAAKTWYYQTLIVGMMAGLIGAGILWFNRGGLKPWLPELDMILAVCLSPLGVFASAVLRSSRNELDANSGQSLHRLESISRMLTGAIATLLILLLVSADLLLTRWSQGSTQLPMFLAIGILGGASERILPSLINRFDQTLAKEKWRPEVSDKAPSASEKPDPSHVAR